MTGETDALRAEFAKLLAEVQTLKAQAAGGEGSWAARNTGVGHPDVRTFPDHPGVNPNQLRMDIKEMETMLLAHEKKLNGGGE